MGSATDRALATAHWRRQRNRAGERYTRVLIADGQDVMRIGLRAFLSGQQDVRVIGETVTMEATVTAAACLKPDVILIDARLSGGLGLETCRTIVNVAPGAHVLVMTQPGEKLDPSEASKAGALGLLSKTVGRCGLLQAIRGVQEGRGAFSSNVKPESCRPGPWEIWDGENGPRTAHLSNQERRLLPMVAEGKTNKEIAVTLGLSDKTVKNYLANVFTKLGVKRRAQVAALYVRGTITMSGSGVRNSNAVKS